MYCIETEKLMKFVVFIFILNHQCLSLSLSGPFNFGSKIPSLLLYYIVLDVRPPPPRKCVLHWPLKPLNWYKSNPRKVKVDSQQAFLTLMPRRGAPGRVLRF